MYLFVNSKQFFLTIK